MTIGTLSPTEKDLYKIVALVRQLAERENSGAPATISATGTANLDGSYAGKTVFLDASAGSITLTIAAAASLPVDWLVRLVRVDGSANAITVSATIDGRATARLISQYDSATIRKRASSFVTSEARWKRRILYYNYTGSSQTFTVANEVPLGCNNYLLEGVGAGGSGAGGDTTTPQRLGGGGGGAMGRKLVATTLDTSLTFSPGQGGAPVAAVASPGTPGNAGGNTTITGPNLGTLTAGGGAGAPTSTAGGAAGSATGAWDESIPGEAGFPTTGLAVLVGMGGNSPRAPGGKGNVGATGSTPGGGGAGSNHVASNSGAGGNGWVAVYI